MNLIAACLIAAAALAQPAVTLPEPPPAPAAAPQAEEPLNVSLFAIKASAEGRDKPSIPEELKPIAKALAKLTPNDTFEIISVETRPGPFGQEVQLPINGLYTGHVTLNETRQASSGEGEVVDFNARIEMLRGSDFINALSTRGEAVFNQALIFRGLELGQDELVVVIQVAPPDSDQSNQGESGDESSEEEQEQEDQKEKDPNQQDDAKPQDLKNEPQEPQDPQDPEEKNEDPSEGELPPELKPEDEGEQEPQDPDGESEEQQSAADKQEGEAEEPKDMQTLEAMLENLEELDRNEQRNAHYRRTQVKVRGDWW